MIGIGWLADPARCPDCGRTLPAPRPSSCPRCELPLTGPVALDLWNVSSEAKRLLDRRDVLLRELRAEARESAAPSRAGAASGDAAPPGSAARTGRPAQPAPTPTAPPAPTAAPRNAPGPAHATPPTGAGPRPVRQASSAPAPSTALAAAPEMARRRVARLVLGTGVLLLVVAAVVFVAVTWHRAGTGGRAVVMGLLLVLSAGGAAVAERRELPLTAEALGALSVVMGVLDGYAAWAADLGGLRGADGLVVSAATLAAVGGAAWAGSRALGLRTLRVSAALLLQAPLPLLAGHVGVARDSLLPLAAGFAFQAAVEVALLRRTFRTRAGADAEAKADAHAALSGTARLPRSVAVRVTVLGVCAYWCAAFVLTLAAPGGGASVGTMAGVAVVAGFCAWAFRAFAALRHVASGACAVAVCAALAMGADRLGSGNSGDTPAAWAPAVLAVLILAGAVLLYAVPRPYRAGPLAVLAVPYAVAAVTTVAEVATAVGGPLAWLSHAWEARDGVAGSRALLTPREPWGFGAAPLLGVSASGCAALVAAHLLGRGSWRRLLVPVTAASWLLVVPLSVDVPLPVAVGWYVAGGVAFVMGAPKVSDRAALVLRGCGIALIAVGAVWSLASAGLSIAVWAVVAVVSTALTRVLPSAWRPGWAAGVTAAAFVDAVMAARWAHVGAADTGVGAAVAGAAVVVVCCLAARGHAPQVSRHVPEAVGAVGAAAALVGTAASATRGAPSWALGVSLGAAAVAAVLGVAVRPVPQRPFWAVVAVVAGAGAAARGAYAAGLPVVWTGVVAAAVAAVVSATAPSAVARRLSLVKAPDAATARAHMSVAVESAAAAVLAAGTIVAASDAWARVAAFAAGALAAVSRMPEGRSTVRPVWAPAAAAFTVSAAAAGAGAATSSPGVAAFTAVCVAAGLVAGLVPMPSTWVPRMLPVGAVSAIASGAAVIALAAERPGLVWAALAIAGAAALVAGRTPRTREDAPVFRRVAYAAGALLWVAAYWDGLAYAGVTVVEAYTLPPGAALLVAGGWLRRARPAWGSWQAFGAGLAAVLLPSVPLAVADEAALRPALLGAASFACVVAGARLRLQAPLVAGAGVLSVVAVLQLSAPVVSAYHALPRWAVLAGAGVLLIAVGAGYERRLRDLARFGRAVRSLD
ncbi:hypothetical protein LO772_05390 [Yinghuangia sp. ASG 101]|uniref:SCO7613 C-terminal domain-containing membrane protein n=1 Tax=Yinghuangia sp. ASG 101 TaxID=2896848 RepID=UPI001E6535D0|nr:hypothetical protein [Yinghuangia sp. ASG 101]UGQ13055.1 hypothetical protein LO772_05390 [Yinghuangia sp. ASG 101]